MELVEMIESQVRHRVGWADITNSWAPPSGSLCVRLYYRTSLNPFRRRQTLAYLHAPDLADDDVASWII
eukprot:scaffold613_cov64-Cylindrotheca_fusiformis.AAC.1